MGCGLREVEDYPLRAAVLREGADWGMLSNRYVMVFATDAGAGQEALRKATYARHKVGRLLRAGDRAETLANEPPFAVYLVDSTQSWERLLRDYRLRQEGISMSSGREILVLRRDERVALKDSIPHEMVHGMIRQRQLEIPLALEEGMALHFGWEINLAYHLENGQVVEKKRREPESEALYTLRELMDVQAYPADPQRLRAFYYQSDRLVRALVELLGTKMCVQYAQECGQSGKNWQDVLQSGYNCSEQQLEWLQRVVESSGQ
jgi:hypothetical protein